MDPQLAYSFEVQGRFCNGMGSPLYGELMQRCAQELAAGSPSSPLVRLLDGWRGDVTHDFVALRVAGAVHALVLSGRAPQLASHCPSTGGAPRFPDCWHAFRETLAEHLEEVRPWLARPPQTNEVQRRAGCDKSPIDVTDEGARIALQAYFWPDDVERVERVRRACERVAADPPRLETARAADWLAKELSCERPEGVCLSVFHSSFWTYLSESERNEIEEAMLRAGERATSERPLAWLRAEDDPPRVILRLTTWPSGNGNGTGEGSCSGSGEERRLASVHPHGRWIHWKS